MKRGDIRTLIPHAYMDLNTWPAPELSVVERDKSRHYLARRGAVEGYANGHSFDEIKTGTGKSRSEVKRLVSRCLTLGPDGQIQGFWALLPGWRVRSYHRAAPIRHRKGSGSGGCAGALDQLFGRFPEVQAQMDDLYLGRQTKDALPEARMSIRDMHRDFKTVLRQLGFKDTNWPFNTTNEGYKALAQYFKKLHYDHPERAALARYGADAARRHAVGNGMTPIIPVLRPFSFVQLDFHKVDAASVLILKNDFGESFEIPLSRWYVGLLCEEVSSAILGYSIVLALNPSGDDTLSIIENAIMPMVERDPAVQLVEGNHVVINQLIPELRNQCFAAVRMDNAWCNAAGGVVNNIIATVGCAVNFGPTYCWWRRPLVERTFGDLTRCGLQREPSTHGTGPGDTKVDNPNEAACVFRIEVVELIRVFKRSVRRHNHARSKGLQYMTPLGRLQAALDTPGSGLFPQPLPRSIEDHCVLMMYTEEVTVRGNLKKGDRPHFNLSEHRHTNELLASSYHLLGKTLVVYVDRRLARRVFAVVKETGQPLGEMVLSGPWKNSAASWRDRQLLMRAGRVARDTQEHEDPMQAHRREKEAQVMQQKKSQRKHSSRTALDIERMRSQERSHPVRESTPPDNNIARLPDHTPSTRRQPDPFGLSKLPDISLVMRGDTYE